MTIRPRGRDLHVQAAKSLISAIENLAEMARDQYRPDECPLGDEALKFKDHKDIAEILCGQDMYYFNCPFCGEEFQS